MILDHPSKRLEIVLGTARTTTDMPVCVSFEDNPAGITGALDTQTNGTTAVVLVTGADLRTKRTIKDVTVNNVDTLPKTVTIRLVNGSTIRQVYSCVLQVGDMLGYTDTRGWYVKDSNGNTKTIAAPNTATSGISPVTSSASPDIFGQSGYTINLDNSTPVTTISLVACTSAQVGSTKKVIPAQNWSITASANLIIDGATSGTFVMPAGANLEFFANTTTQFKVTTIFASGTWTPNQGAGLTVVGAFSSGAIWTKIGNQYSVHGSFSGATSVASAAAGVLCTNLPFTVNAGNYGSAATSGNGIANNAALTAIIGVKCQIGTTTMYSGTAMAATTAIIFSATYPA